MLAVGIVANTLPWHLCEAQVFVSAAVQHRCNTAVPQKNQKKQPPSANNMDCSRKDIGCCYGKDHSTPAQLAQWL